MLKLIGEVTAEFQRSRNQTWCRWNKKIFLATYLLALAEQGTGLTMDTENKEWVELEAACHLVKTT